MRSLFVHSPKGLAGRGSVGSAFICKYRNRRYLVTAAHVPSGEQHQDGVFSFPEVIHVRSETRSMTFHLYDGSGRPRFLLDVVKGRMSDLLILPISRERRFPGVVEYELQGIPISPKSGDQLSMYGFPGANTAVPTGPEILTALVVDEANARFIRTTTEIEPGASGAPCLLKGGYLAGMAIGSDDGRGTLISADMIMSTIRDAENAAQA